MIHAPKEMEQNTFVPWLDSALLPEESTYSVINKVAWFLAITPIQFIRACYSADFPKPYSKPIKFRFWDRIPWDDVIRNDEYAPQVHGLPLRKYLTEVCQSACYRRSDRKRLSVCPECIKLGVHLQIHQQPCVDMCPVHMVPLESRCRHCNYDLHMSLPQKYPAYCCMECGASLLQDDMIALDHSQEYRRNVVEVVAEFKAWRLISRAEDSFACCIERGEFRCQGIAPISEEDILLIADRQRVVPPAWVRKPQIPGADISFICLDMCSPLWKSNCSQLDFDSGNDPGTDTSCIGYEEVLANQHHEKLLRRISEDRFRVALRRVSSVFLAKYRHLHTQCLDVPQAMFNESLHHNRGEEDILECCPLAIGFWIWRITSADYYSEVTAYLSYYFTQGRYANIDLLLYSLGRSHLHYCIHLAKSCVDVARANPTEILDQALSPLNAALYNSRWFPGLFRQDPQGGYHMEDEGKSYYMRFDISQILPDITCAGSDVYHKRVKGQVDHVMRIFPGVVSPRFRHIGPDTSTFHYKLTGTKPFSPLKRDYIFLSNGNDQEISDAFWDGFLPKGLRRCRARYYKAGGYAVVDSAIDSKFDPAAVPPEKVSRQRL